MEIRRLEHWGGKMTHADIINGLFEGFGGVLLWMNVRKLWKDKEFKGVSAVPTAFFMLWGYWNLYFYPFYSAWLSFLGGLIIVSANTVWLGQMLWYGWLRKRWTSGAGRAED